MGYILLPAIAALSGIAGAIIRAYELKNAFDYSTGLAIPNSPPTYWLIFLSASVAVLFIVALSCLRAKNHLMDYEVAFRAESVIYASIAISACLILLLSAVTGFYSIFMSGVFGTAVLPDLIMCFLAFISSFCLIGIVSGNYRGRQKKNHGTYALIPVFYMCMWIILSYRNRAADPVILDYAYEILAVIFSALGIYFASGFAFLRPGPKKTVFFSLVGAYLSIVTLADMHSLAVTLSFMFCAVYLLLNSAVLLKNLNK